MMGWLHDTADHLFSLGFAGWNYKSVFFVMLSIACFGLLIALFGIMPRRVSLPDGPPLPRGQAYYRTRPTPARFAVFLFGGLIVVVGFTAMLLVAAAGYRDCRTMIVTATYQFPDEEQKTVPVSVGECRDRPVGDPTFGPWARLHHGTVRR